MPEQRAITKTSYILSPRKSHEEKEMKNITFNLSKFSANSQSRTKALVYLRQGDRGSQPTNRFRMGVIIKHYYRKLHNCASFTATARSHQCFSITAAQEPPLHSYASEQDAKKLAKATLKLLQLFIFLIQHSLKQATSAPLHAIQTIFCKHFL